MNASIKWLKTFVIQEDSPTMVEYGLLIIFIAIAVVLGATVLGTGVSGLFTALGNYFSGVDTNLP